MKKRFLITITIIIVVIIFSVIMINSKKNGISSEVTKCIGEKAVMYTQLGCHACENQEKLFGEESKYLTIVDCWYEQEKCAGIEYTPTWIINGKKYIGIQSIEKLKELTGC